MGLKPGKNLLIYVPLSLPVFGKQLSMQFHPPSMQVQELQWPRKCSPSSHAHTERGGGGGEKRVWLSCDNGGGDGDDNDKW